MSNFQQGPYLRDQRKFPANLEELAAQTDLAYIDIASKMNARTIGIFSDNFKIVTGESWYLDGQPKRQQTLRKVFQFEDADLPNIPHGIDLTGVIYFTRIYGTFFDTSAMVWDTLPYVDVVSATNQINLQVSATDIIITKGGGTPPTITSGLVILEWLSQF